LKSVNIDTSAHHPVAKEPVIFVIFKRAETTALVFQKIREYAPTKLFIVADGPRPSVPGEAEACAATREIVSNIDWDCDVERLYSDSNLGSRVRIQSGLNEIFQKVDSAVILEDDCLPDSTFFNFMEEMLSLHRHNPHVGMVSGNNYLLPIQQRGHGFYLSALPHIWGWGTWKRVWDLYEPNAESWEFINKDEILRRAFAYKIYRRAWKKTLNNIGEVDAWDYQWAFTLWKNGLLSAAPRANLVFNLGLNESGTNTLSSKSHFQNRLGSYRSSHAETKIITKRSRQSDFIELTVFRLFAARHMDMKDWMRKIGQLIIPSR
jgi:hypothetical protein